MVSFFGLKVGGKKKKSDKPLESTQQRRLDQNALGEGQFFGKNIHNGGVINGSIREGVSRPGTSASSTRPGLGAFKSPYTHDTHNFAASSMYDLSNVSHSQLPNFGGLKTSQSDANLRAHFGNTSTVSLSPPNLAKPTPGFSSRPATANGKVKPWVNPLDIHFMRNAPTGPPRSPRSPLSPLGQYEIPPTPKSLDGDGHSLFGDKTTDSVVDDLFASIEQRDKDEREAKEREKEEARKRMAARLEKERLEREKAAEALQKPSSPTYPPPTGPSNPMFRGNVGTRPASPGPSRGHGPSPQPGFRGHTGLRPASPAQALRNAQPAQPGFRGNVGPRPASPAQVAGNVHPAQPGFRGNMGPRPASPGPRRNEASPQPIFRGDVDQRPSSAGGVPRNGSGPMFRGNFGDRPRSPGPQPGPTPGHGLMRPQGPPQPGPDRRGPSPMGPGPRSGLRLNGFAPNGPRPSGPVTGGPPSTGLSGLPPSPSVSSFPPPVGPPPVGRPPNSPGQSGFPPIGPIPAAPTVKADEEAFGPAPPPPPRSRARPTAEESKPVIQNVRAKRETLVVNDHKRLSLSMKIEELEKSLVAAQISQQQEGPLRPELRPEPLKLTRPRSGSTSSHYSDQDDDDEPISPIAISPIIAHTPGPLHPSPPLAATSSMTSREQSPVRHGAPRIGQGVHRPRPSDYGVKPVRSLASMPLETRPRGVPNLGSDPPRSVPEGSSSLGSGPPSRANTPQFRPHYRPEDHTPIQSPEPPIVLRSNPDKTTLASAGFKFDFPTSDCPPTPDSLNTSWPLNEPASIARSDHPDPGSNPASPVASLGSPDSRSSKGIQRDHAPAPLSFDFSPSASSRAPNGPFTPPIRMAPRTMLGMDERPHTAGNPYQARGRVSPPTVPFPRYEEDPSVLEPSATGLGIGMTKHGKKDGLLAPKRRPNHGLVSPTGIADQFGTKFL